MLLGASHFLSLVMGLLGAIDGRRWRRLSRICASRVVRIRLCRSLDSSSQLTIIHIKHRRERARSISADSRTIAIVNRSLLFTSFSQWKPRSRINGIGHISSREGEEAAAPAILLSWRRWILRVEAPHAGPDNPERGRRRVGGKSGTLVPEAPIHCQERSNAALFSGYDRHLLPYPWITLMFAALPAFRDTSRLLKEKPWTDVDDWLNRYVQKQARKESHLPPLEVGVLVKDQQFSLVRSD